MPNYVCPKCGSKDHYMGTMLVSGGGAIMETPIEGIYTSHKAPYKEKEVPKCKKCDTLLGDKDLKETPEEKKSRKKQEAIKRKETERNKIASRTSAGYKPLLFGVIGLLASLWMMSINNSAWERDQKELTKGDIDGWPSIKTRLDEAEDAVEKDPDLMNDDFWMQHNIYEEREILKRIRNRSRIRAIFMGAEHNVWYVPLALIPSLLFIWEFISCRGERIAGKKALIEYDRRQKNKETKQTARARSPISCNSCGKEFESKNKLFEHLKEFPDHNETEKAQSSTTEKKPQTTTKLGNCPDCEREISKRAASCPHCGCPNPCNH